MILIFQQKIRTASNPSSRVSIASIHPEVQSFPTADTTNLCPYFLLFNLRPLPIPYNGVFQANHSCPIQQSLAHHAITPLSARRKAATVAKTAFWIPLQLSQQDLPTRPTASNSISGTARQFPIAPSLPKAPPIPHSLQSRRHVGRAYRNLEHE